MYDKAKIVNRVQSLGVLAVIRGPSPDLTLKMVEALVNGGIIGIEITYSTPNAEEVVTTLANQFGDDILLGMGTLTSPKQAESARTAGASFLVSPVCEPELVHAMIASGLAVMVGALTPTEVFHAYSLGADIVKVFPGSLAGPSYLKALKGPFPNIPMMPTGGVSEDNVKDWFAAGALAVGAGSKLCPRNLAIEGKFEEIEKLARNFRNIVEAARKSN